MAPDASSGFLQSRKAVKNPKREMRLYFTAKDLAQLMGVSTRTVKRTAKVCDVPPTVRHNACLRWRYDDAYRLLKAWESHKPQSTNGHRD